MSKILILFIMETNKNISWGKIISAIVQGLIAALTALGVASCTLL